MPYKDPAKQRAAVLASKHRSFADPIKRERIRAQNRKAVRRLRMVNPNYALQWERDEHGRWFKAAQSADGSVTREFIRELELTEFCPYCSIRLTDATRVFDHVQPIARGGVHSASNLAACCTNCNGAKGKLTLVEFLIRRCGITERWPVCEVLRSFSRDGVRLV